MADKNRPFIAIIGGFYHMTEAQEIARAQKLARKIGAELAAAGMGLVVYNSDLNSLEPHVVKGFVQATPKGSGKGSIRVRFFESQRYTLGFPEQDTRDELFQVDYFPDENWETPFYRSLAEADGVDAVLLMAGGKSTYIAGQIAIARPLPVLAIDEFDGSAKEIRRGLALITKGYPSTRTHKLPDMAIWLKEQCDTRAEELARIHKDRENYLSILSQRTKAVWTGSTFLLLLIIFLLGVGQTPQAETYPALTFIGLVLAGSTGALVRSYYWGTEDTAPYTSLLLGGIAGLVVGLAYLIPQWIGAPGLLAPEASQVTATDKVQFISAVLVALPAGIGFDTIFNRLREQAKDQSISPSRSK